ncbi:MAG: hypothetical protein M3Q10_07090, partial [Chloroflexota bacterium]|nr:hypothetical protein [Chloroflexota bacterium]
LLGREHAARRTRYRAFRVLWDRFGAEGMRAELAALSALPLGAGRVPTPNGRHTRVGKRAGAAPGA